MLDTLINISYQEPNGKFTCYFFLTTNNNDREQGCLIMVMIIFILIVMSFIHFLKLGKLK